MPRPCAVELHVRGYKKAFMDIPKDATALCRGASRLLLLQCTQNVGEVSHYLLPKDSIAGVSNQRETPRRKAVASLKSLHSY